MSSTVSVTKHTANQILQTTSYYLQQTFSLYKGTETVAVTSEFGSGTDFLYWSATRTGSTRYLKFINYYGADSVVDIVLEGPHSCTAKVITLTAPACNSTNSLPQLGGESTSISNSELDESDGIFTGLIWKSM